MKLSGRMNLKVKKEKVLKEIKKLEEELIEVRSSNEWAWDHYGSELCTGEMIANEEKLEKRIEHLKKSLYAKL